MFKIKRFAIGKRKQYKGITVYFYRLKLEMIKFCKKRLYRIEWNDWNE
jgi:hypothetical protein